MYCLRVTGVSVDLTHINMLADLYMAMVRTGLFVGTRLLCGALLHVLCVSPCDIMYCVALPCEILYCVAL